MAQAEAQDRDDWLGESGQGSGPTGQAGYSGPVQRFVSSVGRVATAGWVTMAVGVVLGIIGYVRVSDTPDVAQQLTRLSTLTAAGLFLAVIGAILIFSQHYQGFMGELRGYREEQAEAAAVMRQREETGLGFGPASQESTPARTSPPRRRA